MAICQVGFKGESIGKRDWMNVVVPQSGQGPWPVLYLLHGLGDDFSTWARRTRIEWFVESGELPLIVVMPDGARSFYVNRGGLGDAYEDYIVKDVVGFVDRLFPTIPSPQGRAIAGNSMGGYGAIMLAMRHTDVFSAAASHSGAMGFLNRDPNHQAIAEIAQGLPAKQYNCFELAKQHAAAGRKLAIRFDCGSDDFLIQDNRDFDAHLTKLGVPHEWSEHPGTHGWDYWELHIRDTLTFVMKHVSK